MAFLLWSLLSYLVWLETSNAEIIHCGTSCSCSTQISGQTCRLYCLDNDQCKDGTLRCRSGDDCIIQCYGESACAGNTNIIATSANNVNLYCIGEDACNGNTKLYCGTGTCDVACEHSTSCEDLTVIGALNARQAYAYSGGSSSDSSSDSSSSDTRPFTFPIITSRATHRPIIPISRPTTKPTKITKLKSKQPYIETTYVHYNYIETTPKTTDILIEKSNDSKDSKDSKATYIDTTYVETTPNPTDIYIKPKGKFIQPTETSVEATYTTTLEPLGLVGPLGASASASAESEEIKRKKTFEPTFEPTSEPTSEKKRKTSEPTIEPTSEPTVDLSASESASSETHKPRKTETPTSYPTRIPTVIPSLITTQILSTTTPEPTEPTVRPTPEPTPRPTRFPIQNAVHNPTLTPTQHNTQDQSDENIVIIPTAFPTENESDISKEIPIDDETENDITLDGDNTSTLELNEVPNNRLFDANKYIRMGGVIGGIVIIICTCGLIIVILVMLNQKIDSQTAQAILLFKANQNGNRITTV